MKKLIFIAALFVVSINVKAQTTAAAPIKLTDTAKLYNPAADAKADIADAVKRQQPNIKMYYCKLVVTGAFGASGLIIW
jgi:hypothetical protein